MDREGGTATLHSLVEENLSQYEDRVAILYDTGGSNEIITYREMWSTATLVKDALSGYSLDKEVVGLCLEQDKHIPALILGVLCSGAAFYNFEPENPGFVAQVIHDIHIRVLVIDIKFLNALQGLIFQFNGQLSPFAIPEFPGIIFVELHHVNRKHHHGNLAYCITTSGTTGRPKIVQVPHCCIVPNIIHIRSIYNLTSDDLVLLCSPLTFDPYIVELFTSLSVGACVLIVPSRVKISPELLMEMIYHRNKVTVMQCTPSLLRRWNPARLRETILGNNCPLRVMSLGGERFPALSELQRLRASGNQTKFYNLYGITEVSSWASCYEVTEFGPETEVHLGFPLLDTEIKVCDDSGHRIEDGTGRIYIGGKNRQCIIGSEEDKQYNKAVTRWRDTGDIGRITKDGRIYYIGREDTQIKRHGKRLNLEEVNQLMRELEFIRCCTTQLIDNRLVLFLVTDLPTTQSHSSDDHILSESTGVDNVSIIKKAVIDRIRCQLPSHYTPDDVVVIENLPVTKHGKVNINELLVMYRKNQVPGYKDMKPVECLTKAWKIVLCIDCDDSVSDSSLFLEAGGDSFKAVKLLDNLELQLHCKLPKLLDLLMIKPFRTLCDYVKSEFKTIDNVTFERAKNVDKVKLSNNISKTALINRSKEELNANTLATVSNRTAGTDSEVSKASADIINCSLATDNHSGEFILRNKAVTVDVVNSDIPRKKFKTDNFLHSKTSSNFYDVNKIDQMKGIFHVVSDSTNDLTKDMQKVAGCRKQSLDKITAFKASTKRSTKNDHEFENKKVKIKGNRIQQQKFCKFIQRGNKTYMIPEVESARDYSEVETWISNDTVSAHKDSEINTEGIGESESCGQENGYSFIDTDSQQCDSTDLLKVELKERWRYNTGKCVDASPLLAVSRNEKEDMVFIGSHSHKFSAVSMATGNAKWEITLGDRIESSACMSRCGNYVIVGCYDGNIYTVDAHSGHIFWRFQTGSEAKSSPTVDMATGLVYVGSHSHCLYALNIEERQCVWKVCPECGSIFSSPVVSHNPHRVYMGTLGGYLVALGALTGEEVWRYSLGKPIFSSPCVSGDGVIVGCVDNYLYHVSHTGTLVWKFETSGPVFSSPVLWNSCTTIGYLNKEFDSDEMEIDDCDRSKLNDSHLHVEETFGENKNNAYDDTDLFRGKTNRIICGCHGNRVYCLTETGKLIWQINTDSPVYSTPFVDRIHVTDQYCDSDTLATANPFEIKPSSGFSEVFERHEKERKTHIRATFPRIWDSYGNACVSDMYMDNKQDKSMNFSHSKIFTKKICGSSCKLNDFDIAAFASTKGNLYLVKVEKGTILCKLHMDGEIFSSPVLYRNCLVVGCRNDMVYCFDIKVQAENN